MKLPKFIIVMDGVFRLGMVDQHKHLLKPDDQCFCISGCNITSFTSLTPVVFFRILIVDRLCRPPMLSAHLSNGLPVQVWTENTLT